MAAGKRGSKAETRATMQKEPASEGGAAEQPKATRARSGSKAAQKANAQPAPKTPPVAETQSGAEKPPAAEKPAAAPRTKKRGTSAQQPDLRGDLREFASARPDGWSHQDWLRLLDHLRARGHDTQNPDAIGRALERERLTLALERVDGLESRQVQALVDRFDTLWSLRQAGANEIASVSSLSPNLAERVAEAVR